MVKKETESDKNGQEDNLEDIQEVSETPMDLKNTEGKKEQVPKQGCIFIRKANLTGSFDHYSHYYIRQILDDKRSPPITDHENQSLFASILKGLWYGEGQISSEERQSSNTTIEPAPIKGEC